MIYHDLSLTVFLLWREQLNIIAGMTGCGKKHVELALKGILKVWTFPRAPEGGEGLLEGLKSGLEIWSKLSLKSVTAYICLVSS